MQTSVDEKALGRQGRRAIIPPKKKSKAASEPAKKKGSPLAVPPSNHTNARAELNDGLDLSQRNTARTGEGGAAAGHGLGCGR